MWDRSLRAGSPMWGRGQPAASLPASCSGKVLTRLGSPGFTEDPPVDWRQAPGHPVRDQFPLGQLHWLASCHFLPLQLVGTKNITPLGQWTCGPNGRSLWSILVCPGALERRGEHKKYEITSGAR